MQNLVWGTFFTKVSKMVVKIWPDQQLIYEWVNFIMENWNEPRENFIFTVACPYHNKHCSEEPLQYKTLPPVNYISTFTILSEPSTVIVGGGHILIWKRALGCLSFQLGFISLASGLNFTLCYNDHFVKTRSGNQLSGSHCSMYATLSPTWLQTVLLWLLLLSWL